MPRHRGHCSENRAEPGGGRDHGRRGGRARRAHTRCADGEVRGISTWSRTAILRRGDFATPLLPRRNRPDVDEYRGPQDLANLRSQTSRPESSMPLQLTSRFRRVRTILRVHAWVHGLFRPASPLSWTISRRSTSRDRRGCGGHQVSINAYGHACAIATSCCRRRRRRLRVGPIIVATSHRQLAESCLPGSTLPLPCCCDNWSLRHGRNAL